MFRQHAEFLPCFCFSFLYAITSCLVGGVPLSTASADLRSGKITPENFLARQVGGPDSIAGSGDWFLSNGTICAAISSPEHKSAITPQGGVLIDLGHCGAQNDQWTLLQPLLNLSDRQLVPVTRIEAGADAEHAWLRAHAEILGVEIITTYAVDLATPTALSVSHRARRVRKGGRLFAIGSLVFHPSGQTPVFSLLRRELRRSLGFVYPGTGGDSPRSLMKAFASSDLTVLLGGDELPPVSYGVEHVSSTLSGHSDAAPLASFSITTQHFTLFNSLTRPLWFGAGDKPPGLLGLVQLAFMDVKPGSVVTDHSRIWLGRRADVASITDQLWKSAPRVRGTIDDPDARIHIDLLSGAPVTEIRPNPDGTFAAHLPAGHYRARVAGSAGRATSLDFEVTGGQPLQSLPPITLAEPGWVRLPSPFIGRLIFLGENSDKEHDQDRDKDLHKDHDNANLVPVVFGEHYLGLRIGDELIPSGVAAPFLNLAGSPLDRERVSLSPGRYRVIAVRGPEYEAASIWIEVRSGEETRLDLKPLLRVAATPGWIAADLHVHSGASFDSNLPQTRQIAAFAASGAEVLVATEHDRIFDPRPAIARSGLSDEVVSITGVETTSANGGGDVPYTSGHLNVFPVRAVRAQFRGGAPSLVRRRLRDALADIHRLDPAPFIQLNHPRPDAGGSESDTYFSHLGIAGKPFDPLLPLSQPPNSVLVERSPEHGGRDLDFHGVELLSAESLVRYRRTRADWLSLMLQGERIVGTANSDSHRLGNIVGLPRTYVQVANDALDAFDENLFMDSLRRGRVYGTTGPLVTVRLDDAGLGDLHRGVRGTLHIAVNAAPWVPVNQWRAYVNGKLVYKAAIAAGGRDTLPLEFEGDAFVTVEVEGPAEGLYRDALPDFTPFAFTNPIFVDADGNGRFDAPGL